MAEDEPRRRRRTFVPALVVGLAGGALAAVAGNQAWVEPSSDSPTGSVGQVAAIASDASSPLTTAVALVSLACWGVLLVTRGGFRRVIAWFGAGVAAALVVVTVLGWSAAPGDLTDLMTRYGVGEVEVRRTVWCWVAVGAAPFALAAALLAARDVRGWPQMGSRYDAPTAQPDRGPEGSGGGTPAAEQSNIDLWKSLDEGGDPTS